MRALAATLLGAVVWTGLRGRFDLPTLVVGAVLGAAIALAAGLRFRPTLDARRLFRATSIGGRLAAGFAVEVVTSNLQQLRLVLDPRVRIEPRWVHVTCALERPASRACLGVLVSMTPGTVTTDLDGRRLSVHVLSAESDEAVVSGALARFEALLLELEGL